jgi:hypothetical protein
MNSLSGSMGQLLHQDDSFRAFRNWDHQTGPFSHAESFPVTSSPSVELVFPGHPPIFDVDIFQPFKREEPDHPSLFLLIP